MQPTKSRRIEPGDFARATVYLVGCGGTGSFAALHLARLAYVAKDKGIPLKLIFIDPDHVEAKNLGRQNFAPAEIGLPKAATLARRYSFAFGLQIESRVERFKAQMVDTRYNELSLLIGCVDNAAARRELAQALGRDPGRASGNRVWWLDSGNDRHSGQVLIGNARQTRIDPTGFAAVVAAPSVQEPELLKDPVPDPTPEPAAGLSCAELLAMEAQSLMINQAMAGIVGTYAFRLLLARDLDVMRTYVNLESMSMRSVPVAGEVVEIGRVEAERRLVEAFPAGVIHGREVMDAAELDDGQIRLIYARTCPNCGGALAEGMETIDEAETEILFCPACEWLIETIEVEAVFEGLEEGAVMDRFYGPVVETEEDEEEEVLA